MKPEDICTANDLHKLPVITKQDIIDNYDKFISKNCIKFLTSTGYTSGTTGTPSKFLRDLYSINFESAALWRHWLSSGYKLGNRRITIRGTIIKNATDKNPPFGNIILLKMN